jgi:hypothetical protein
VVRTALQYSSRMNYRGRGQRGSGQRGDKVGRVSSAVVVGEKTPAQRTFRKVTAIGQAGRVREEEYGAKIGS